MELLHIPPELRAEVILSLQPRFVYKLMCTNKAIYKQCMSQQYWERVAFHLAFRGHISSIKVAYDLYDMALLSMGYKRAMDTFIAAVREDIRTAPPGHYLDVHHPRPSPDADGPLSQLIPYALDFDEYALDLTGEKDARLVARGLILDTEHTSYVVQDMLDGHVARLPNAPRVLPVSDGSYITEERRRHRASARFLQALEDEPGLDLDAKRRLLASAVRLVEDIIEERETTDWGSNTTTQREAPISSYKWVSIMRDPFPDRNTPLFQ